jgi:tryptophan synthase beta chain
MVRDFQSVIGEEARAQIQEMSRAGCRTLVACVGGGSNAIGLSSSLPRRQERALVGVEAGGRGPDARRARGALLRRAAPGVLHGTHSYVLQDDDGQIALTHSVSAGLDYALVGPEHAWLHDGPRRVCVQLRPRSARGRAALIALEGIIPALESAHAVAEAIRAPRRIFVVKGRKARELLRVNLSSLSTGRGDQRHRTPSLV